MSLNDILQPVLLLAAAAAFGASFFLGLARLRAENAASMAQGAPAVDRPCQPGMQCFFAFMVGLVLALALLGWRLVVPGLRLDNDLDVFLLLGLLLAALVGYFRITHHLLGLALFLVPMIAIMMIVGAGLALLYPGRRYDYHTPLTVIHVLGIVGGTLCFAAGCVGGVVYLLADRQLRRKGAAATRRRMSLPPLGAVERFNQRAVLLGFPLLTLAIVTGFIRAFDVHGASNHWALFSKVALSLVAWAIYTPLLHVRLLPAFRGQRAAALSIIGFGLLLTVFVVSTWVMTGK